MVLTRRQPSHEVCLDGLLLFAFASRCFAVGADAGMRGFFAGGRGEVLERLVEGEELLDLAAGTSGVRGAARTRSFRGSTVANAEPLGVNSNG